MSVTDVLVDRGYIISLTRGGVGGGRSTVTGGGGGGGSYGATPSSPRGGGEVCPHVHSHRAPAGGGSDKIGGLHHRQGLDAQRQVLAR